MELTKHRNKVADFFWILFIIFITDAAIFSTNSNSVMIALKRYTVAIFAAILLFKKEYNGDKSYNLDIFGISFIILISMAIGRTNSKYMYYTQIACLIFAICFSKIMDQETFAEYYIKIMRIVAVASLVGWIFEKQLSSLSFIPVFTNTAGIKHRFYLLFNIPMGNYSGRNTGPFWEPGAYQFYLNLGVYFSLFVRKKLNLFDVLLFTITCITTKSGASFVGLGLFVIAYAIKGRDETGKTRKWLIVTGMTIIIIYMLSNPEFYRAFEKTYYGLESEDSTSYGYRLASAITYFKASFLSPLWGNSPETLNKMMMETMFSLIGVRGSGCTNTILGLAAYYGWIMGIYVLRKIYCAMKQNCFSELCALLLTAAVIAITSNENFMTSLIFWVVMFLKSGALEKLQKDEAMLYGNKDYRN